MTIDELSCFENEIVSEYRDRVGARRASQQRTHSVSPIGTDGQWHEVSLNIDLLPKDLS